MHQLHAHVVDDPVFEGDVGVFLGHRAGRFEPQAVGVLHDVGLVDAGDFFAAVFAGIVKGALHDLFAAGHADRLDRDAGFLGGRFHAPIGRKLVDEFDQLGGLFFAALELDARVQVFGVFTHNDQIDRHGVKERANALVVLARPDAGEQAQSLPQVDVDAAKAGADRRGDGGLEGTLGAANAVHDRVGQGRATFQHHIDAGLLDVPIDFDAGRIDAAPRRLGQFRTRAISRDQRNFVCHDGCSTLDPKRGLRRKIRRFSKRIRLSDAWESVKRT